MTRYVDTERYKRERDAWVEEQMKNAPPLTERQIILIRANLPSLGRKGNAA